LTYPLTLSDLNLWLVVTSLILVVSSEFMNSFPGARAVHLSRRKFRVVALVMSAIFLSVLVAERILFPPPA
jgi:hypothetical protein